MNIIREMINAKNVIIMELSQAHSFLGFFCVANGRDNEVMHFAKITTFLNWQKRYSRRLKYFPYIRPQGK